MTWYLALGIIFMIWLIFAPYIFFRLLMLEGRTRRNKNLYRTALFSLITYILFVIVMLGIGIIKSQFPDRFPAATLILPAWVVLALIIAPYGFIRDFKRRAQEQGSKARCRAAVFLIVVWGLWVFFWCSLVLFRYRILPYN